MPTDPVPLTKTRSRRWGAVVAILLWGAAGGLWGYARVRALGLGAALSAGGSDARGEAWRMARTDPEARRALEENAALERRMVHEEETVQGLLHVGVCALAALGLTVMLGGWRSQRRTPPAEPAPAERARRPVP